MSEKHCLNCEGVLDADDKFCRKCGQSAKVKRLKMKDMWKVALKKFLHADSGIIHLTRELALHPGTVALEYVQGHRKKYYAPLNYLTLSVAISVFLTEYFHLMDMRPDHPNPGTELASRHFNLIVLLSVPISGFFSWLLFRAKGFNFAEVLVLQAYLAGFRTVFFVLIFTPLVIWFRTYYFVALAVYLVAWAAYLAWAKVQFFGGPVWSTVLKAFLTLFLNQVVVTLGLSLAIWLKSYYE